MNERNEEKKKKWGKIVDRLNDEWKWGKLERKNWGKEKNEEKSSVD